MEPATHQQTNVPGAMLGGGTPRVRPPQVVTSLAAATQEAVEQVRHDKLDQRLTAVLQGFVEGFACDGADYYALNDATNELVLKNYYHAGESEAGAVRRTLSASRADVAAMAGSVVVLEDDLEVAGWPVPVWCGAAVCLPVASDESIHGTVWLYSNEPRAFADAELQLAEVVAGRLAVELELAAWRNTGTGCNDPASGSNTSVDKRVSETSSCAAPVSVRVARPSAPPMLDEWELAGWTGDLSAPLSYFDWQTLADGRTLVAAGSLADDANSAPGWLEAARIALRAHAPTSLDAGELLTQANRTLWLASPGGEGLAVAVALLDGDGSRISVAAAGDAGIARWRAARCDWKATSCPPLGWSERAVYAQSSDELMVRERLLLVAAPHGIPTSRTIERVADRLRRTAADDVRSMPGKRALRVFSEAAHSAGFHPGGVAMVRRR